MAQQEPPSRRGRDKSRATIISVDSPNVDVGRDDEGRVRVLRHPREVFSAERAGLKEPSARGLADAYVREVLPLYDLTDEQAVELSAPVRRQPIDEGPRLKVDQEKTVLDTVVVSYQQTVLGLPIWQAALQVRMYGDPLRVASSDSTLHEDVRVEPPPAEELGRFADDPSALHEALGLDEAATQGLRVNDTRLLVYRNDPDERLDPTASVDEPASLQDGAPTLPLPPVPDRIKPGRHYVVREVLFSLALPETPVFDSFRTRWHGSLAGNKEGAQMPEMNKKGEERAYGVYRATVTDEDDPEGRARVKVRPANAALPEAWARVATWHLPAFAGGSAEISAGSLTIDAGMSRFSGVVQADTVITNSVVASSYTPGAGNIW